ncbi:hypothetical protein OGR47_13400 [Methylocystis sp. MJC1]|jgi:hypothetical protein|uniref:hypothetical protein n=1 Tax=Methylocystis sp. MJC1 TaxID=2654282 RepID=UPI0013EDDA1C|nr:hypothetical protein [Methylocystis sp. MJC1]KAF2989440.1 hypothetical protein MJC1_03415 [Methylocystis sp. MJC1]MBU6527967.1 hypothetical protein [Methylocystis sp. MJC1]UZX10888.1 hypothetical protein OGR47_13400 [Methylocystis sp. MJC1]
MRENGPAAFFRATSRRFRDAIKTRRGHAGLIGALCVEAFDSFDKNVPVSASPALPVACEQECGGCLRLRAVATAPEILLLAHFLYGIERGAISPCDDGESAAAARHGAAQRPHDLWDCPLIENRLCLAHKLRPLACRGLAGDDELACDKLTCVAAAGEYGEASLSKPNLVVRSLVQNAMMNALRREGMAWGLYEIARGLRIARDAPTAAREWLAGGDPLAPASAPDFDRQRAAAIFDTIDRL